MIIIEGADNCGKTTLSESLLADDPTLHIVKRRKFRPDQGETIATRYISALTPTDGDRVRHGRGVMDRLLASECIYGDLLRGGSRITPGEHLGILNLLVSYQAIIVHCDVSDEVLLKTWEEREQLYDNPEDMLRVARAYRKRIRNIFEPCPVIQYDWSNPDAGIIRDTIHEIHQRRNLAARRGLSWWSNVPYGAGQLDRPSVIMVGDRLSPNLKHRVPFSNGPAGNFLAWSLEQVSSWNHDQVYITNGFKGTDRDEAILREEFCFLSSEKTTVILLGNEAEGMYRRIIHTLDDPPQHVVRIPHPQYWRRFRMSRRDEYPRMIESILTGKD